MIISEITAYQKIQPYKGLIVDPHIVGGDVHLGVELELEQVVNGGVPNTFKETTDGSLKLEGKEFVSIPIQFKFLRIELDRLFGSIKTFTTSARCSLHVHMNVQDLTWEELFKLTLLYLMYERVFFRLSGDRWKSNYCTPLHAKLGLVKDYFTQKSGAYKYSALNLAPVFGNNNEGSGKYGTVEFRHHRGAKNSAEIIDWCSYIVSLKLASQKYKLDELLDMVKTMNTSSAYINLTADIFGKMAENILILPTFKEDVEGCITALKGFCFDFKDGKPNKWITTLNDVFKKPKFVMTPEGIIADDFVPNIQMAGAVPTFTITADDLEWDDLNVAVDTPIIDAEEDL